MLSPDLLPQFTQDRQDDLRASAAARRLSASGSVRRRFASTLRRAADRLDSTPTAPGHPLLGRG